MAEDRDPLRGRAASVLASPAARFALLAVLVAGLVVAVLLIGAPSKAEVQRLVAAAGVAAPIAYVAVYVVLTMLMFPGSVVTAAGGVLFGTWFGTLLSVLGATAGATGAFVVGRWLGREQVDRVTGGRVERVDRWLEDNGFLAVLYLRLVPVVPFNVLNYVAGVTALRRRDYVLATAVGIIPGTFAYSALGSNLDDPTSPAFLGAVGLVVVLAVGGPLVNRVLRRRGKGAPQADDTESEHEQEPVR